MGSKKSQIKKRSPPGSSSDEEGIFSISHEPPHYFQNLLSSISPIVTLGSRDLKVRFASDSFLREFDQKKESILSRKITSILPLSRSEKKALMDNIGKSDDRSIQNAEFTAGDRIFGYTLFRFEDEVGIILKEITSIKLLQNEVESLHARLLKLQEKERQRIAAELHDSVGQTILAAKLNFTSYSQDRAHREERFQTGLNLIDRASEELREIYTNLYPTILRDLGLEAAIKWYAKNYLEVKGIGSRMSFRLHRRPDQELEAGLFRMVQELLNNIVKHSGASMVRLNLSSSNAGNIRLKISDNGTGFDTDAALFHGGLGLRNLESRVEDLGGKIQIQSSPEKGTETVIELKMK